MKFEQLASMATIEISGVDKKTKENETPIELCNFTDVYHNWAITSDNYSEFMSATAKEDEINTFKLKKGQVAITKDSETRDDIGISTYIAEDFKDVILGYHTALITPDKNKLDGAYLNAYMHSKASLKHFENNASGSGQRYTLSDDAIKSLKVLLPDTIEEQKRIAKVFNDIDLKISLNKKIQKELEIMAKEIYDYWFVQFDFPDINSKPYKSSGGKMIYNQILKRKIPEGWNVEKIGNILDSVPKSKKIQSNEYLKTGIFPIIDQGEKYIAGYTNEINIIKKIPAVVFGDHSCRVKLINFPFARGADGTQILYSNKEEISEYYLYFTVIEHDLNTGYARHFAYLRDFLPIIIPPKEIGIQYTKIVKVLFEKIKTKIIENIELLRLRDELLPLLMNGQVSVIK